MDPAALEIQWQRLITIMDETDATVVRTSFSSIVGESRDFACILLDVQGRSLAQSTFSSPAFTCTLPATAKHLLQAFPPETLAEGDVLMTNDPWLGSGHLPDIAMITPVFYRGRRVAFTGSVAHVSDLGGKISYFEDRDLFEEGLRLPPCKFRTAGRPNNDLEALIRANSRTPDMVIGDLYAIAGAQRIGARRLVEFLEDYGLPDLTALAAEIHGRSEEAMRQALRTVPDGTYRGQVIGDGYNRPVHVVVAVIKTGDEVTVDFTGSSAQFPDTSINCVRNLAYADTVYPFKCALLPHLPNNEGLFRPIRMVAPAGSVFNTTFPSAVRARSKSSFHIHSAVYLALAQALGQSVQAGSGSFWTLSAHGVTAAGEPFRIHMLPNGGKGALPAADGLPTTAFPYNGTITPTEIVENTAPLLVEEKSLRCDSGGPGQQRGGLGQRLVIRSLNPSPVTAFLRPDKLHHPAVGLCGGGNGGPGEAHFRGEPMPLQALTMESGDRLEMLLPGGGGYGSPLKREPARVAGDVAEGLVSPAAAHDVYGVVLACDGAPDPAATVALRASLAQRP
jgi:N-methylhydantoinase B